MLTGAYLNVSLKLVGDDVVVAYDDGNQIMKCFVALAAVDDAAPLFTYHLLQQ